MTTDTAAYEAIRAHHRLLNKQFSDHVTAVSEAAADGQPHELAVAELVAYLAEEILPHALAEEQTIYRGLHWPAWVTNTIVLAGEHKELTTAAGRLADLPGGTAGRRS